MFPKKKGTNEIKNEIYENKKLKEKKGGKTLNI